MNTRRLILVLKVLIIWQLSPPAYNLYSTNPTPSLARHRCESLGRPPALRYDFDWEASCPLETSCWARANGLSFWIVTTNNTWSQWRNWAIYKGMPSVCSWRLVSRLTFFLIERRCRRTYPTPNGWIVEMDCGRSKISATQYSAQDERIFGYLCGGLRVVCLCLMASYWVVNANFLY